MKTFAAAVSVLLALSSTASAQFYLVQKGADYTQLDSTGALAPVYNFSANSPAAGSITPPSLSAMTLPYNSNQSEYLIFNLYSTKAALDAAFPNGNYQLSITGQPTVPIALSGDLYPANLPQVNGATWQNHVLVVNPAVANTLNFSNFSNYGSTASGQIAGHMEFQISTTLGSDNVNIDQSYATVATGGKGTVQSTPFSSYTIAANALKTGNVYQATLDYDVITTFNTTSIPNADVVGLYEYEVNFYIAAQGPNPPAAPVINAQPSSFSTPLGSSPILGVSTTPLPTFGNGNSNTTQFVWLLNNQPLQLGNTVKYNVDNYFDLTINSFTAADVGVYQLEVINSGGVAYSQMAALTVGAATAPTITVQPQNATVTAGQQFTVTVGASGTGPFTYQWNFNGVAISGNAAKAQSYGITSSLISQAGVYTVTVTNSAGTLTSLGATVTINPGPTPPSFTLQPASASIASGSTVVFNAIATGNPTPTLQWQYNGLAINGATSGQYVVPAATSANAGNYSCIATNTTNGTQHTVISSVAQLSVSTGTNLNPGRLANLSMISNITGSLSMGFVTGGAGTSGSEPLLVRAVGPSLGAAPFNYPGTMPDPTLTVTRQSDHSTIGSNSGWGTPASNATAVNAADAATGAFALSNTASLDSALALTLPVSAGGYSAVVASKSSVTGNALTEVYDATSNYTLASPRLVNLSCLTGIATGGSISVGFVIGGTTAKTVLVRAGGPVLTALFGIGGALPDPLLQVTPLSNGAIILGTNAGWGGSSPLVNLAASVGAFSYPSATSADSVVALTLAPGGYTAHVSGVSGDGGSVIVEVYEVP